MSDLLSLLPLLACPVGMGVMMALMMRGTKDQGDQSRAVAATPTPAPAPPAAGLGPDERLAALRDQLRATRAEQDAIAARIDQLAGDGEPVEPRVVAESAGRTRG